MEEGLEADYLQAILCHLALCEEEAKSELRRRGYSDDWRSAEVSDFQVKFLCDAVSGAKIDRRKAKKEARADNLYKVLGYISHVRECIEKQWLLQAIKYSLRIALYLHGDAISVMDRAKQSGSDGASKPARNAKRDEQWIKEDEELARRKPKLSQEWRAQKIADKWKGENKPKTGTIIKAIQRSKKLGHQG